MATGTVKWFNLDKGFGFLANDDGSEDVFVHFTNIDFPNNRDLQEGQPVEFEIGEGQKGPQALHVSATGDVPADYQPARPSYGGGGGGGRSGGGGNRPRKGFSTGNKPNRRY
jgi:CspA family cold shock protein